MSQTFYGGNVIFNWAPQRLCPICNNPANVVMRKDQLTELLEQARRITHPDVCDADRATEVTAGINACLDAIRRYVPPG